VPDDAVSAEACACGEPVDPQFASKIIQDTPPILDVRGKCRQCKVLMLLHEGIEVDKYCYHSSPINRRRKVLQLSEDKGTLQYWPRSRPRSWAKVVQLKEILGVVFGAYTHTFKKQRASEVPPHWASFSLVGLDRSYDFSAKIPDTVECCIRGFQQVLWKRQQQAIAASLSAPNPVSAQPMRQFTAAEPWSLGLFLWMRLRFRLQEEAQKRSLGPDHMLWVVFMHCAFKSSDELTKARFIHMAEGLKDQYQFRVDVGPDMRDLYLKIRFQKERVLEIVEDRYECHIHTFLPRAPSAVVGGANRNSGGRRETASMIEAHQVGEMEIAQEQTLQELPSSRDTAFVDGADRVQL